jgi:pimeloyl-ACP methyl ester carboxylesterase
MPHPEQMDPYGLLLGSMRAFGARSGRLSVGLISAALLGSTAACGTDPAPSPPPGASPATASTVLSSEAVDELVRVGEGRLHVRCVGAGATTVLLISGFNDGGDSWGEIESALAHQARVCSYARFGTGASDPPTQTQTFATSARDLHALLAEIGQQGPYVVVGHSYGGGQAVTFASRYRTEVDGLVLLDATPPGWIAAGCAVPDDGTEAAASFRDRCPDPADPADNPERMDEDAAFAGLSAIESLDALPLAVVTAADHPFPGLEPSATARLNDVWDAGQEGWLSLSSEAHLVSVDNTGHYIQLDRPDVVLSEIRGLLP